MRVRAPLGVVQARRVGADAGYQSRTGGDESLDPGPLLCPFPVQATA